jgi:DNA-binding CsgD family transcriptional regulator
MANTPPRTSRKTAEREAAAGALALAGGGNGPAVAAQPVQLANDHRSATALSSDAITVIAAQSQIDSRAAPLQAKLTALGIDDVSEEGELILGGAVAITPGLRKGVGMSGTVIATSDPIDLATVPEMFDYTRAGGSPRPARSRWQSAARRSSRRPARATHGWASLTASEQTIVSLVGEGLTNTEIGERLYISRRTVESPHLGRLRQARPKHAGPARVRRGAARRRRRPLIPTRARPGRRRGCTRGCRRPAPRHRPS